jgi:hypothetical protein
MVQQQTQEEAPMIHRDEIDSDLGYDSDPLVIAYHTPHTEYAEHARAMKESAELHHLQTFIREIPTPADDAWRTAVHHKPYFILNMLAVHPNRNILYVDVDARFRLRPLLFLEQPDFDISYHRHRWKKEDEFEHISAVIYFSAEWVNRSRFVQMWADRIEDTDDSDQEGLKRAYMAYPDMMNASLSFRDCGPEHYWVHDRFPQLYPGHEPVIEHLQESRKARNRHLLK